MTIHEVLFSPARQILMPVVFLLLAAQLTLFFASIRDNRTKAVKALILMWFLLHFGFFYLLMADIFHGIFSPDDIQSNFAAAIFTGLPVTSLIVLEAVNVLCLLAACLELCWYRKNHPSFRSIKETLDLLPAGIAFKNTDGTTVFSNLTMNRLSPVLGDHSVPDPPSWQVVTAEDHTAWQFSSKEITVDGTPYIQLTASDISEEAAIERELKAKNERLRDIHMRLDIYNKQAARMIIAQELLTARMAVHNEVGNILLESRRYLNDPSSFNEKKLLQALRNTNTYLFHEYEEDDTKRDPLTDALEMADAIGVDVTISGRIPSEESYRAVLSSAVNECATNTVKHAGGNELSVEIKETEHTVSYIIFGNGEPPKETIAETGGLHSLCALVEKESGNMILEKDSALIIQITLPKKKS